jgi:hypothetical protein
VPVHDIYANCIVPSKFDVYCLGAIFYEILTGKLCAKPLKTKSVQVSLLQTKYGDTASSLLLGMLQVDQF